MYFFKNKYIMDVHLSNIPCWILWQIQGTVTIPEAPGLPWVSQGRFSREVTFNLIFKEWLGITKFCWIWDIWSTALCIIFVNQTVKNLPVKQEMQVRSLGQEEPLKHCWGEKADECFGHADFEVPIKTSMSILMLISNSPPGLRPSPQDWWMKREKTDDPGWVCSGTLEREEAACPWEQEWVAAEVRGTLRTDSQRREGWRREAWGSEWSPPIQTA